jgi:CheY-like chemotaxis protein
MAETNEDPEQMNLRSLYWSSGAVMAMGAGAAIIVAATAPSGRWSDGFLWSLYMLTTTLLTIIVGFVFAVPRTRAGFVPTDTERYESNDNLVQISDWLTKLLVGAGLVQLTQLPGALADLGDFLKPGIGLSYAEAYVVSAVLYGAATGFATGYLWTRLRFRPLLEQSDREARKISSARDIADDLQGSGEASESAFTRATVAADAVQMAEQSNAASWLPILWVDDNPSNNRGIVRSLVRLGITVEQVLSTAEAMARLQSNPYAVVISDLGRVEAGEHNPAAGRDLLVQMAQLPIATPVIIFAGPRGVHMREELLGAGARLVSQNASEVFIEAARYVTGQAPAR